MLSYAMLIYVMLISVMLSGERVPKRSRAVETSLPHPVPQFEIEHIRKTPNVIPQGRGQRSGGTLQ
jgi:hypothetical protein